jgi:hypothetical protein
MPDSAPTSLQFGPGITGYHPIKFKMTKAAKSFLAVVYEEVTAQIGSFDHRCESNGQFGAQTLAQNLINTHQFNSSRNNLIVPPQVRPTANASSSE